MPTITKTFSDAGTSDTLLLRRGESFTYEVDYSADFDGGLFLEYSDNGGLAWVTVRDFGVGFKTDVATTTVLDAKNAAYRFRCILDPEADPAVLTGTVAVTLADAVDVSKSILDSAGSPVLEVVDGGVRLTSALRNSSNVGTAETGVTAVEYGDGRNHQTVLTLDTTLPAIAGGANLGVGKLLYTLPAGAQIIESAYMSVAITQTEDNITADTPEVGLGTVIASGAVAVLSGTATFEDIITGQVADDCDGAATVKTAIPTAGVPLVIEAGDAKTIHLNVADGWAADGDAAALLTGTVVINWRTMA